MDVSGYTRADFMKKSKEYDKRKVKVVHKRRREYGKGTVDKSSSKSNPFRAKVPVGTYTDSSGRMQVRYKSLGNFKTKAYAEAALEEYNRTPYDLESRIKTFADLYEAWSEDYFSRITSDSSKRTIESAYAYCEGLYDMPIRKINVGHIKDCMNHGYRTVESGSKKGEKRFASLNTKERIKSLCNLMFDYAVEHNLCLSNPARAFNIKTLLREIEQNTKQKKVFTNEQVEYMFECVDDIENLDMVIIGLYTGFRPVELCSIRVENVNLEEGYIIEGVKTLAGKNRMVPIHSKIYELVENRYKQAVEVYESKMLFNVAEGDMYKSFTYDIYRRRFEKVMLLLDMEGYSPHCTRTTFATTAEISGLRDRAIKLIMGHSLRYDVTESNYKKTDLTYLKREMEKLTYSTEKELIL